MKIYPQFNEYLGELVKTERINSRLSTRKFGELLGLKQANIYRMETGTAGVSVPTLFRLREVLSLDLNALADEFLRQERNEIK